MIDKAKLDRINELAKKLKTEGLTEEEQAERKALHQEYIQAVRSSLKYQLESIIFVDEDELSQEEENEIDYLTDKFMHEFEEQNKNDEELRTTVSGNPSNPVGIDGEKMLERMNKSHLKLTDWGLTCLGDLQPKNILDIGCGGGAAIKNLAERFPDATIYGIDTSEVSVNKTIETNRDKVVEDKVRVTQGSVEDLPYGDNFFDLVISVESYYFWPDFKEDLLQIRRVLKPDGMVLIMAELYGGTDLSDKEKYLTQKFTHNLYSPEEFKKIFEEDDFKNINIHQREKEHWICVQAKKK